MYTFDFSSLTEQLENLLDNTNNLYKSWDLEMEDSYSDSEENGNGFSKEIKEDFQEASNEENNYEMEEVFQEVMDKGNNKMEMEEDYQKIMDEMDGGESTTDTTTKSDAGTPIENSAIPADENDGNDVEKLDFGAEFTNPNNLDSSDRLVGGEGANTFEFNPLINAKPEIYEKHTDDDGTIDWKGVAGENDNYHDHWVDGIGNDAIADFSGNGGEGDKIKIVGHTVAGKVLEELENQTTLGIYSDQGADGNRGDGAHDFDVLGTIEVNHDGNFDFGKDVSVNPNVFDGAFVSA